MNEITPELIAEYRKIHSQVNGELDAEHVILTKRFWVFVNVIYKQLPALLDEIERLQARIAELEEAQRWIPFSEQSPPDEEDKFIARVYKGKSYWYRTLVICQKAKNDILHKTVQDVQSPPNQRVFYATRLSCAPFPGHTLAGSSPIRPA